MSCGKRCGCLLLILSMVVILVMGFIPLFITSRTKPVFEAVLQPVLCVSGGTLNIYSTVTDPGSGQLRMNTDFSCRREDMLFNVNQRALTIGGWLSFVPLLVGFGVLMWDKNRQSNTSDGVRKKQDWDALPSQASRGPTPDDRLEELKRAYEMNVISEAEYQRTRQAILDEM